MNSKQQYFVNNGVVNQQVYPMNDADLEYSYEQKDNFIYYQKKLKTKLKFHNNQKEGITDYDFFYSYESNTVCNTFTLTIKQLCDGVWVTEWVGEFSLNEGDWDLDRCTVEFQINPVDIYNCIDKKKDEQYNFLNIANKITMQMEPMRGFEFFICAGAVPVGGCPNNLLPGNNPSTWAFLDFKQNFTAYDTEVTGPCNSNVINIHTYFRETVTSICNNGALVSPGGGGWVLETNQCNINGTSKWVRYPQFGTPLPFPGTNPPVQLGYYNPLQGAEKPPYAKFHNVVVTATPATPPIYGYPFAQTSAVVNSGSIWYYTVRNNPNSTYVWSFTPSGTGNFVIASGQGTNQVGGYFTGAFVGNIAQIVLTETHGNGYVSTATFSVTILSANSAQNFNISGPLDIDAQTPGTSIKYKIGRPPISNDPGVTVSAITWTPGGAGFTVQSQSQGDVFMLNTQAPPSYGTDTKTLSYSFTVTSVAVGTITVTGSINITNHSTRQNFEIEDIIQVYANEPNITFNVWPNRPNGNANFRYTWRTGTQVLKTGTDNFLVFAKPVGNYCLSLKEFSDLTSDSQWDLLYVDETYNLSMWLDQNAYPQAFPNGIWQFIQDQKFVPNQRRLKEVIEYVLQQMNCGVNGVKSDYFEWNPPGDIPGYSAGVNYVTQGSPNKLRDITLGSVSDFINWTATQQATIAYITFDKIDTLLKNAFRCFWYIDNNNFMRIEHEKTFNLTNQFNALAGAHAVFNAAKNKYSYEKVKIPRRQKFTWENSLNSDFIGLDIIYDSLCTYQDQDNNDETFDIPFITTDVDGLYTYPTFFNIAGLVLLLPKKQYNFVGSPPFLMELDDSTIGKITLQNFPNCYLSWANLQWNFHRYNRPQLTGNMNGNNETFFSIKKVRVQKDIILVFCCDDSDDQLQLINVQTGLGNGIIKSAELNKKSGRMKLTLLQ